RGGLSGLALRPVRWQAGLVGFARPTGLESWPSLRRPPSPPRDAAGGALRGHDLVRRGSKLHQKPLSFAARPTAWARAPWLTLVPTSFSRRVTYWLRRSSL